MAIIVKMAEIDLVYILIANSLYPFIHAFFCAYKCVFKKFLVITYIVRWPTFLKTNKYIINLPPTH